MPPHSSWCLGCASLVSWSAPSFSDQRPHLSLAAYQSHTTGGFISELWIKQTGVFTFRNKRVPVPTASLLFVFLPILLHPVSSFSPFLKLSSCHPHPGSYFTPWVIGFSSLLSQFPGQVLTLFRLQATHCVPVALNRQSSSQAWRTQQLLTAHAVYLKDRRHRLKI